MLSNSHQNEGFSLIEMLIALAVFSIILLALNQTELNSAQVIMQDYFKEKALTLIHNTYEKSQWMNVEGAITEAAEKLPQGEGTAIVIPEHINIEISWSSRFSEQRDQLNVDI
jgi:prepilin-type N-terminal cleavage/methylation domain-containing protein